MASSYSDHAKPQRCGGGVTDDSPHRGICHRDVGAEEIVSGEGDPEPPSSTIPCMPAEGDDGGLEHSWKCSCYPRIESYDGPAWEVEHVLSGRQSGPCRTRRAPDFSKPLGRCSNYEIGVLGEDLAEKYLEGKGWEIIARNYRSPVGEADIVAHDDEGALVMVEVKSRYVRGATALVMPEIAVDFKKQRRYQNIALFYLSTHSVGDDIRFDVIAVNLLDGHRAQLRHLEGAFVYDDQGARGL